MGASTMLSRVNALVNVGYGEELDNDLRSSLENHKQSSLENQEQSSLEKGKPCYTNHEQNSFTDLRTAIQEEYKKQCSCDFVNEEMGILNRKGGKFSSKLYGNNEDFREEIINFDRDKKN